MHKFFHFAHLKPIFSILHNYFYEIPTSVCLFNTFFYLNNIFLTIFYYSQLPMTPPVTLTHTPKYIWSLSLSISFSLSSFFFFSFSFFLFLNFFFFSVFIFLLLLLMLKQEAKERKLLVGKFFSAFSSCSFAISVWLFIWVWWFFFLGEGLMNLGSWFRSSLKNFMICCWI